ncbi:PH domain-containing protein [Apilactobacillus sp. TMW 2.2459]|uniref:PH domain-containing protein n=1 Tax=Apilactobacillus xinyiensis TaxID=2841032 RepID=UPI001C7E0114|nr:PH domain-containing protein [Apilactobacillus xinyiensis]MCL0312104.1 PH domain-containing protein [Apilactobacillus xinyiensis]
MNKLPLKVKKVWMQSAMLSLLIWIILLSAMFLVSKYFYSISIYIFMIVIGLALLEVLIEYTLIPYRYAFYSYNVSETEVRIKKGFIFRSEVSIPIARVQNVHLSQGPLLRTQGLTCVAIVTASNEHTIEALTQQEADELRLKVIKLAMEAKNVR